MEPGRELVKLRNDQRINDLRSRTMQIGDSSVEQSEDLWIGSIRAARLPKHGDPSAHRSVPVQKSHVSRRNLSIGLRGCWVRRVDAGDDVKQSREVGDGAGHRTCSVALVVKPNHAGPGNQRPARAQANMALLEAGFRIEPKVSDPRPTTPKLAASPDPVPPDDPPVA